MEAICAVRGASTRCPLVRTQGMGRSSGKGMRIPEPAKGAVSRSSDGRLTWDTCSRPMYAPSPSLARFPSFEDGGADASDGGELPTHSRRSDSSRFGPIAADRLTGLGSHFPERPIIGPLRFSMTQCQEERAIPAGSEAEGHSRPETSFAKRSRFCAAAPAVPVRVYSV